METTPSLLDKAKGLLGQGGWKTWGMIIIAVLLIGGIGYLLYTSLTPSKIQASGKAKPVFATYDKVTKIAPLGCPGAAPYRLCDFYMASSSPSVS